MRIAKLTECLSNGDTNTQGRVGVLAGDDSSINDDVLLPKGICFLISAADALDFILEQSWHELGQLDGVFFGVAETSGLATAKERLSVHNGVHENDGAVADSCNNLAGIVELLNQLDGVLVVDEIEHGPMATGVENGIKLGCLSVEVLEGGGLLPKVLLGFIELDRGIVLEVLDRYFVNGSKAASRGSNDDFGSGLCLIWTNQVEVRTGKLRLRI